MSFNTKIGLVNFVTNTPYGSIHKFCPTVDFMQRLKEGKITSVPYYSRQQNETQEYNNKKYELHTYPNYFGKNNGLTIAGYINQACNFYMVSKFLNNGLTFIVLNLPHSMSVDTILEDVGTFFKILKNNAPNSSAALLLRYPETNKWCCLANSPNEIRKKILDNHPDCIDVLIHPFSYTVNFEIINSTFLDIQDVIKKYYKNEEKFVSWSQDEISSLDIILHDKVLSKKSVYTEETIRSVCNASHMNADIFMKKLVECGAFSHFNGNPIGKYYFKNGLTGDRIIPVLMSLFDETTYIKKPSGSRIGRHFITSNRFRSIVPDQFKKKIMMYNRLILKVLDSLKVGRTTIEGNKLYLRRYDFDELDSTYSHARDRHGIRFIYE